jgi:uncharacterized phage protein gp47/JayE
MTFRNGRFDPEQKEEILNQLINGAEQAFGQELDTNSASVIRAFYDPVAEYLASQQTDIRDVVDAAQIDHATGSQLDLLAALIGVVRREAVPAKTRLQFQSDTPVAGSYTVPEGEVAQTDAVDAIRFETDYVTSIRQLDGFEDNDLSNYGGDSASFSIQTGTVFDGTYALEGSASSSGTIVDAGNEVEEGSVVHWQQRLAAGSVAGTVFAAENTDNHYRFVLDEPAGEARMEVLESGTVSQIDTAVSLTVPTGEWLDVKFDWENGGDFVLYIEDSSGNEVLSNTFEETTQTYTNGGIGFYTGDTVANEYWDVVQMSATSVDATAVEPGTDGNVGAETLVVMPSPPNGIDAVTNPRAASGGLDREQDDDFRTRAKTELSQGMRATLPAIINGVDKLTGTRSVTVITNDQPDADAEGRPPHSFEVVVDADSEYYEDIAERILDRKAAGDISVGGYAGSSVTREVELVNGQLKDITFSIPTQQQIYVDCDITKTDTYAGDEQVRDNIVQYTGGTLTSQDDIDGEIGVGDDVVYFQVVEAVMDVEGVHNITNLEVGTTSSPTGTSDIAIGDNETAYANANDNSLDITSSDA